MTTVDEDSGSMVIAVIGHGAETTKMALVFHDDD